MAQMRQFRDKINVKQLNLHHCKSATALIGNTLRLMHTNEQKTIFLIQEPWIRNNKIQGLNLQKYNIFQSNCASKIRTCIVASKELSITLLPQYSNGDLTTTLLNTGKSGCNEEIIIARATCLLRKT